jgi:RNA polymerase sigma-70 factor (ECF subfamily)
LDRDPGLARFEQAAAAHLDAAYNLARWLTRDPHDAEDVVQEAYLRAWRYRDSFRGGDLRPWLLAIVRNCFMSWKDKNHPPQEVPTEPEALDQIAADGADTEPETMLAALADREHLTRALEALPAEFREVLVLRELEDLSYKEIATVLEVPMGTVMSRLARARQQLRARLRIGAGEAP